MIVFVSISLISCFHLIVTDDMDFRMLGYPENREFVLSFYWFLNFAGLICRISNIESVPVIEKSALIEGCSGFLKLCGRTHFGL